jgi:glycosyltransferase involved in cell wall biosynthesis
MAVSILILTLNEERNLPDCLQSVGWARDVVVFDSYSSDRTLDIARQRGARVVQRRFDNWAAHQNWAMENIEFANRWVFYIDADERMTPELQTEIDEIASDSSEQRIAFYVGRKNYFMGRWLRHAMPPGHIMRFFVPRSIRFERLVNPVPVLQGAHGYLRNLLLHYNFSKGIEEWIDKHNRYSTFEALEGMKLAQTAGEARASLFSKDAATRRRALKNLSFRLPGRPILKFVYLYLLRLGFLDGRPGFTYCGLQAWYEHMITLKMTEARRRNRGLPV